MTTTKLWTAQEAAEFLRMSVSWVYQAASRGELPSVRVGRALRFEASALMQWVSRKTEPAKLVSLQRSR